MQIFHKTALFLFVLIFPLFAGADTELARLFHEDTSLKAISKGSEAFQIELTNIPQGSAKISAAGKPAQIIVELKGKDPSWWGSAEFPAEHLISNLNIASEKNIVRIVFACRSNEKPKFKLSRKKTTLFIDVTAKSAIVPEVTETPAVTTAPTLTATPTSSATFTATQTIITETVIPVTPVPDVNLTPTVIAVPETPAPTLAPTAAIELLSLQGISFIRSAEQKTATSLRLEFSKQTAFELSTKDAKTYLLRVANTSALEKHLTVPYFPPADFDWLVYVLPKMAGNSTEITIAVEDGVKLKAIPQDTKILISPER
jgi:hypothetical protein